MKIKIIHDWSYRAHNLGLLNSTIITLILLSVVATITEILGIGIFLPIFQFIRLEGDINALIADSILWKYAINVFDIISVKPSLAILLILSFILFSVRQIFTYIRLIYTASVKQRIIQTQRDIVFGKYLEANTTYHDSIPVGNLVSVIITEVNGAIIGLMAPMELIVYVIMFIGYLIMLLFLSWQVTLISLIVLLIASRVPNIWIKRSAHIGRNLVTANTLMSEFLVGRLRSPRLVRLSGTEIEEKNDFHQLTQVQRKHSVFSAILQARVDISLEPVVIGLSLIFLYFSYTVLHLQLEVIGMYLVIALRLLPTVKSILIQWQKVQRNLGSIEVIENRIKAMCGATEQDIGKKSLNVLKQSIKMNNISYRYPDGKSDALTNITVELKSNTLIGIVGPSGSGKSTLIDLLPRLRIPVKGSISIDGVNIEKFSLKSLRKAISYVPQFSQIFNGTVREHILYGRDSATEQEIQEAVRMAGAEGFINRLPQRLDTVLGEEATNLSGGQRQRLDLARALIKKSPILILDEPTSNLDAESEELFKQAIYKIRKKTNTTIIIIAHRLASIHNADNIIVLNNGKVDEFGVHLELLSQNGWYAKAWKMQT